MEELAVDTDTTAATRILVEGNYHWSNTSYVSHLPGPLLLVVLDVHNASTTKQHEQNVGNWGIQEKDFQ